MQSTQQLALLKTMISNNCRSHVSVSLFMHRFVSVSFIDLQSLCSDLHICVYTYLFFGITNAPPQSTWQLAPLKTTIKLDRDDRSHGLANPSSGVTENGPETTTFRHLLTGRYDVYVNVYWEEDKFAGECIICMYLYMYNIYENIYWEI